MVFDRHTKSVLNNYRNSLCCKFNNNDVRKFCERQGVTSLFLWLTGSLEATLFQTYPSPPSSTLTTPLSNHAKHQILQSPLLVQKALRKIRAAVAYMSSHSRGTVNKDQDCSFWTDHVWLWVTLPSRPGNWGGVIPQTFESGSSVGQSFRLKVSFVEQFFRKYTANYWTKQLPAFLRAK